MKIPTPLIALVIAALLTAATFFALSLGVGPVVRWWYSLNNTVQTGVVAVALLTSLALSLLVLRRRRQGGQVDQPK